MKWLTSCAHDLRAFAIVPRMPGPSLRLRAFFETFMLAGSASWTRVTLKI
jgi:hypothetical protein